MANMGSDLSWTPVKRKYKTGDTIYDKLYGYRFFMPKAIYRRVGARNYRGSVEGEYWSNNPTFHQYQSVMLSCRLVLTEKVIPESRFIYPVTSDKDKHVSPKCYTKYHK